MATVASAALVVAAATGAWLWLRYRPVPEGVPDVALPDELAEVRWAMEAHTTGWIVAAVAGGLWLVLALVSSRASWRLVATGAAVAVLGGVGLAWSGSALAWDQVVLYEVTTGEDVEGLFPDAEVRSYLVDGSELTPDDLRAMAWLHVGSAALALVGLVTAVGFARGGRRHPADRSLPPLRP